MKKLIMLALVTATAATATAQAPGGQARAVVSGIVFDSLASNAPLAGAEVTIDGTEIAALTDAQGRFTLSGVPAGRAVVRFYHASLDSLGFGVAPVAVTVVDGGTVKLQLATPAPATLHARLCPGPQPQSTGVLLGRVRDVDTRAPLANADVTVRWGEWTIGAGALSRQERVATARSDANGSYAACGVPTDVAVVARATASAHVTGLVAVDFAQRPFDVRDFAVSLADSGASAARLARLDSLIANGEAPAPVGSATLAGSVRGPDGKPVPDAQVALLGYPISVRTEASGAFRLTGVPAGSQTIEVRAVGFAPQRRAVDLATGEQRTVEIASIRAAQTLASVNIVGRGTSMDRTGYESRRKAGVGQFITGEEIQRRGVFDTEQALWNILGARVTWDGHENVVRFTRPSGSGRSGGTFSTLCAPAYWVDGIAMPRPVPGFPEDVNTFVRPRDIRGIEVYISPSQAPMQYRQPDVECGVVIIWTNAPRPKQLKQPGR